MNKLIAVILLCVLMFSLICILPASAETTTLRKSCVTDHFSMLHKYLNTSEYVNPVPPNMDGTCVFVSMSMLLSFYDFYWRDDFVVNASETAVGDMGWTRGEYNSSTDTLSKSFESYLETDAWNNSTLSNYNFALANADIYLQSNLIDMNSELPLYDWPGILDFQARDALEYYL